ncbi:hypothetical protein CYMTET_3612 [Cymbomonas tetramitiformis]|uniref:EF-hand domain-containing protein n=1 Tax=Cymbomonas tetramitiformis TaxID=36881 RepID=A0AAE0LKN7_9CHLO|nr:hypothetical protein CYMTET_3612 [Cymbomonas tetramitiformis]
MAGNDSLEAASTTPKLSEETRRKFDEASEDTLQLICGLKGSLERQALVGALTKVLSKKSEHRHPAEIDLLVQNTRHVKIFERLSIHRHRDVCRLMQLLKTTDGQPLGVNGYITSFYLVLTGTAQRLNDPQRGEADRIVQQQKSAWQPSATQQAEDVSPHPSSRPTNAQDSQISKLKPPRPAAAKPVRRSVTEPVRKTPGLKGQPEQQQHGGSDALNFGLAAGNKTNIVKRHHITTGRETHLTKEFRAGVISTTREGHLRAMQQRKLNARMRRVVALTGLKSSGGEEVDRKRTSQSSLANPLDLLTSGMSKDPQRMTEELKHWFDLMDADSSGSVSMKELRQSLRSMRINIPIHELNRWFSAMDEDGSGQIDFEEFHRSARPGTAAKPHLRQNCCTAF